MTKRILNVVTNVGHYDDPSHPTGLWLSELTHAWDVFEEHVALARKRCEHELDLAPLAVDHGLDVVGEPSRDSEGAHEAFVPAVGSLRPVHPAPQCRRSPPQVRGLTVHLPA